MSGSREHKELIKAVGCVTDAVNSLSMAIGDVLGSYATQDVDEFTTGNGGYYIGKLKPDGKWLLLKVTKTSATEDDYEIDYANVSNNGGYSTYAIAWANRTVISYTNLDNLTSL